MISLGLDLSLTDTGIVAIGDTGRCVLKGRIRPRQRRGCERLQFIAENVASEVKEWRPGIVVIEGYAFGSRTSQAHSIGECGGVVKYMLRYLEHDYLIVPPSVLKKYVTGKGNAPKNVMAREAFRKWGLQEDNDNVIDAYALSRFGIDWYQDTTKRFAALKPKCELVQVPHSPFPARSELVWIGKGGEA